MKTRWAAWLAAALLGGAAAAGGSWLAGHGRHPSTNLHDIVHRRFRLTAAEEARLATAEAAYDRRRAEIEARIRSSNAALAAAIRKDPELSAEAQAASNDALAAAAELQRVTLQHIFEMRSALDPEHRAAYDAVLVDALTRDQ